MSTWREFIRQLHESPHCLVLTVTGGGSLAVSDLLTQPGASSTVLEAVVPYSAPALDGWLGCRPESYCSRETALKMATTAWWRAKRLSPKKGTNGSRLGVACTASLVSDRPKRGEHRCWIAVESNTTSSVHSLVLKKGARDRAAEEGVVRDLILCAIGEAAGLDSGLQPELIGDEEVKHEIAVPPVEIAEVRNGTRGGVWSLPGGGIANEPPDSIVGLLPGSFSPLHRGHEELRRIAGRILDGQVAFELSILNADKPPLDFFSVEQRRSAIVSSPVAITATSRFVEKVSLFSNTVFVVGFDTAERILDPHFYGDSVAKLTEALSVIREAGCRFLVAGRQAGGTFHELSGLKPPGGFEELFSAIPESEFREDVSSSEIRKRTGIDAASE